MRDDPHAREHRALREPVERPEDEAGHGGHVRVADQRGEVRQDGHDDEVAREVEEGGGQGALEAVAGDGVLDVREREGRWREGQGLGDVVPEEDVAVGRLCLGLGYMWVGWVGWCGSDVVNWVGLGVL